MTNPFPDNLRAPDGTESPDDFRLVLEGPRRISRRRKKQLKGAYLDLFVAVAIDQREEKHGPDHRTARWARRLARNCRFRCEERLPTLPNLARWAGALDAMVSDAARILTNPLIGASR